MQKPAPAPARLVLDARVVPVPFSFSYYATSADGRVWGARGRRLELPEDPVERRQAVTRMVESTGMDDELAVAVEDSDDDAEDDAPTPAHRPTGGPAGRPTGRAGRADARVSGMAQQLPVSLLPHQI